MSEIAGVTAPVAAAPVPTTELHVTKVTYLCGKITCDIRGENNSLLGLCRFFVRPEDGSAYCLLYPNANKDNYTELRSYNYTGINPEDTSYTRCNSCLSD